jgi:hypothetical protein
MTPHKDRCISQASASPYQTKPVTIVTTFSFSARIACSGTKIISHYGPLHHRGAAIRINCTNSQQNHLQSADASRISGKTAVTVIGSGCRYCGRKRHGPVPQVFRIA